MSEALISSLQAEINRLNAKNAELASEAKDRRIKSKSLQTELDATKSQLAAISTEHETLKSKASAAPAEKDATIAELQGKLLARDHRDAFAGTKEFELAGADGKATKYKLADGVTVDAVWQLSGYKAEGATPDAKVISEHLGRAQAAHPFLFSEVADPAAAAATQPSALPRRDGGVGARTSNPVNAVTPSVAAQVDAAYGSRPLGRIA